jgi:SPP1 gp7 family putative phage head morphogenesis protein
MDDYLDKIHGGKLGSTDIHEGLHNQYFGQFEKYAQSGFGKKFDYKDPDLRDVKMGHSLRHNLNDFATYKQHALSEELRAQLYDKDGNKRSLADFRKASAQTLKNFNTTYFNVECEAAFAQADTAMKWKGFLEDADVYPNLQYVTAHDEHVRDSHRVLHNIIRPVNDPFWRTHTPPLGYRCRCTLIQTDEAATGIPHELPKSPAGFGHNPGETGEVFSQEHPYFKVGKTNKAELDKVAAKLEYNAFDEKDFTKVQFNQNTGDYIVYHKEHGAKELRENLDTAKKLIAFGERIIFLPIVEGRKSPDTLTNEVIREYKHPISAPAQSALNAGAEDAHKQGADELFVKLRRDHDFNDMLRGIQRGFQAKLNKGIKLLILELPNGRLVKIPRAQLIDGSFVTALKTEWDKP